MTTVYTIGYGGLGIDKFIDILLRHNITCLVDVRRWPKSKYSAYNKMELYHTLGDNGIRYVWLGHHLGGFRHGGYMAYMKSPEFRRGIDILLYLAERFRVCIMCKERNPGQCHRRYICGYLQNIGVVVDHLNVRKEGTIFEF